VPKNFWFLTYFCLYTLFTFHISSYFLKIYNFFNPIYCPTIKRNNYSETNNLLFSKLNLFSIVLNQAQGVYLYGVTPQEGKGTGVCLYGGILPVAVFIFLIFRVAQGSISTGVKITTLCHPVLVRN